MVSLTSLIKTPEEIAADRQFIGEIRAACADQRSTFQATCTKAEEYAVDLVLYRPKKAGKYQVFTVEAEGDTYPIKERLKSRHFRWKDGRWLTQVNTISEACEAATALHLPLYEVAEREATLKAMREAEFARRCAELHAACVVEGIPELGPRCHSAATALVLRGNWILSFEGDGYDIRDRLKLAGFSWDYYCEWQWAKVVGAIADARRIATELQLSLYHRCHAPSGNGVK